MTLDEVEERVARICAAATPAISAAAKKELIAVQEAVEEERKALRTSVVGLESQIGVVERSAAESAALIDNLQHDVFRLEREAERHVQHAASLKREIDAGKVGIAREADARRGVEMALAVADKRAASLLEASNKSDELARVARFEAKVAEKEADKLRSKIADLTVDAGAARVQIANQMAEISELRLGKERLAAELAEKWKEVARVDSQNAELRRIQSSLRAEIAQLKAGKSE